MKISYRPEIDGLRCLAVLAVVFYHAQLKVNETTYFTGGFIGVDIFFVISGYLISSIIFKELIETENFSFRYFYERRVRRILPALFFIIVVSLPFSWIYLYPQELVSFSKSILYTLGFSSNFYFHFSGLEYGSPESILKPYLHTWSLSVEEQFYVIFPIFFILIFKYLRKYLLPLICLLLLISLFFAELGSKSYPSATFYFIHTRIWELLCGSVLAYLEIKNKNRNSNKYLSEICPFIGLSFIIYSILNFNDEMFHPSLITILPVVGVMQIIWFSNQGGFVTRILSNKIFVGLGLVSYSFYLWHYVIFSFAKNLDIFFDKNLEKFILIVIGLLLSILTYFFIEQPYRKRTSIKLTFSTIFFTSIIIISFTSIMILNDGFTKRIKVKNYQPKHTFQYLVQNNKECFSRSKDFCKFGDQEKKVILLGDSHLASLSFDLKDRVIENYSFLPITNVNYFHLKNLHLVDKKTKRINKNYDQMRNRVEKILEKSKNNIIILGGAASLYIHHKRVKDRSLHWTGQFVDKDNLDYDVKFIENDFKNMILKLLENNEVILLYPIPEIGTNLQTKKIENMLRIYKYRYSDFIFQNKEVIDFYDSLNFTKLHKVKTYEIFCNEKENLCKTHDEENFYFYDGYHPSLVGAKMINDLIIEKIKKIDLSK